MSEIEIKTELDVARDQRNSNFVSFGKYDIKTGAIKLYIPSGSVHGSTVHIYIKHALGKYSYSVDRLTCSIIEHEEIHAVLASICDLETSARLDSTIVEELRDLDEYKPRLVKK